MLKKLSRDNRAFIYGLILGTVAFLAIYGVAVLDVRADGWIFKSDVDLRQHYLGWMAYRDSAIGIPAGMTDRLSYPHEMSIVYTDSIPYLAFIFRLFSGFLPRPFQYFGIYALVCYALTGAFGAACLSRLIKNDHVVRLCTLFFVISYPMLLRTFYHTSLSSQWIILLCFFMILSGFTERTGRKRNRAALGVGELCAGIHLYFLPMAMAVFAAGYLGKLIGSDPGEKRVRIVKNALWVLALMGIGAALVLWIMGAFKFPSGNGNYWVGDFTMNLNSPVNPLGHSRILPALPLYTPMQFEGAMYPGLGVLVLAVFCLVRFLYDRLVPGAKSSDPHRGGECEAGFLGVIKRHPLRFSFAVMAAVLVFFSVSPVFAFGDRLILSLPYPDFVSALLGIFRSNGRFIWPVLYLMIFGLAKCADSMICENDRAYHDMPKENGPGVKGKGILVLLVLCVFLQIFDFSGWIAEKQKKYYGAQKTYRTVWDELALPDEVIDRFDGFVIYEDDNSFNMGTAYFAMRHNMTVNTFYFARDIDEKINRTRDEYTRELLTGGSDPAKIYVLDRDSYERFKDCGLYFYRTRKCVFGVRDEIEELEELRDEDLDEISWQ